ncbi:MAG: hypothetical protein C4315_12610, partial [Chloroflexota bacterium]
MVTGLRCCTLVYFVIYYCVKAGVMGPVRIGIDVGGTFTDVVLFDGRSGRTVFVKVPS